MGDVQGRVCNFASGGVKRKKSRYGKCVCVCAFEMEPTSLLSVKEIPRGSIYIYIGVAAEEAAKREFGIA